MDTGVLLSDRKDKSVLMRLCHTEKKLSLTEKKTRIFLPKEQKILHFPSLRTCAVRTKGAESKMDRPKRFRSPKGTPSQINLHKATPLKNSVPRWGRIYQLCLISLAIAGCGSNTFKLEGLISDDFNNPVSGALVTVKMQRAVEGEDLLPPFESSSKEDGAYQVGNLQLGEYQISVVHSDYESSKPRAELLTQTQVLNLKLHNRLSLQGTVFEPDGKTPVFEAPVRITRSSSEIESYLTDANGKFTVSNLKRNDEITIKVFKGSSLSASEVMRILEESPTATLKEVTSLTPEFDPKLKGPSRRVLLLPLPLY